MSSLMALLENEASWRVKSPREHSRGPGNSGARVGALALLGNALQLFISFPWWSVVLKPVRTTGQSGWRLHDCY